MAPLGGVYEARETKAASNSPAHSFFMTPCSVLPLYSFSNSLRKMGIKSSLCVMSAMRPVLLVLENQPEMHFRIPRASVRAFGEMHATRASS